MNRKNYRNEVKNEENYRKDESELIYYNLSFTNTTDQQVRASAIETRTTAILQNPSNWLMSVIRFDVDCHALPINFPNMQIIGGIPSKTATTSFITLEYLGNFYTQNVVYVEDALIVPILTPRPTIYNYQRWLNFVNTAASLAFTASGAVGSPPIFIFDPLTQLINLFIDKNYIPSAGVNQIKIFINEDLYLYFTNFSYLFDHTNPSNPLLKYQFDINNNTTVVEPPVGSRSNLPISVQTIGPGPSPDFLYLVRQLNIGTASWNSIRSLVLVSNTLPFVNESVPVNPGNSTNFNSSGIFPILSDVLVPIENDVTLDRVKCQYLPTAEYRRVDLISNVPLTTVDITIYYSDYLGNLNVIPLIPGASMSVKIVFEKKNLLNKKNIFY